MTVYFKRLFEYTNHTNTLFLDALEAYPPKDPKGIRWMSHVIAAQIIWYGRVVEDQDYMVPVWEEAPIDVLRQRNQESIAKWLELIKQKGPAFNQPVHYQNSKGEKFVNTLEELMAHLVNHGTHHRAQIASLLATEGHKPPVSDFIFYAREPLTE